MVRGIKVYSTTSDSKSGHSLPIALVGLAANATIDFNTITKVTSSADAIAKLGEHTVGDTLPRACEILFRYGCNNLYVITVEDADSIPGSNGDSLRTGIYLCQDIPSLYNESPSFILAPGENGEESVQALEVVADSLRSIAVIDADDGDSIADVVANRTAPNNGLAVSNERVVACYPWLTQIGNNGIHEGLSLHLVGTAAKNGSWGQTVSSLPLVGVEKPAISFNMNITDPYSDVYQLLNAGYVTIMDDSNNQGGYTTWGDRSTAFPMESGVRSVITAIRTEDMVMEQAIYRARKFIDKSSTIATARLATASYETMFYEMKRQGNIREGTAVWDESNSDLKLGKIKHDLSFQINNAIEVVEVAIAIGE